MDSNNSCVLQKFTKKSQNGKKLVKKDAKRVKNSQFFVQYDFSTSDSYQTIGSPMLLIRKLKSNRYVIPICRQLLLSLIAIGISEFYWKCPPLSINKDFFPFLQKVCIFLINYQLKKLYLNFYLPTFNCCFLGPSGFIVMVKCAFSLKMFGQWEIVKLIKGRDCSYIHTEISIQTSFYKINSVVYLCKT